jgi:hypothetical protein
MFDFWETELTEEETEGLIEKAADQIRKRGLTVPAILTLEMHKPLAYIGGQAAVAFAPFIAPITGYERYHDYTRLLSKRENVERLIRTLERDTEKDLENKMEDSC